ncbi:hypothetical protein [Caulobacter sp.]|uniref:hypothetical protein n=1 Tax=Caulobacter sp. TaxID=78 RepID=UPI001B060CC8|nr:hypothetical protein [Caulobacter sp.]MBO9547166.1 hypothetical protein [Caulobacter sp.]
MYTYLVFPSVDGWRVQLQDEMRMALFTSFAAAERRARWLAAHASVKGHDSEILLLDAEGALVGRWHAEVYAPAAPPAHEVAA